MRLDNPDHFNALRAGDVPIWMITNGQLLTPELYERFVVNGPIRSICISIDTVDPVAYTLSRRPGSVAPVIANLETIAKCWPQHCLNKLEAVVTAWNHDKLEPLVHFAAALRVPFVAIDPVRQDLLLRNGLAEINPFREGYTPEIAARLREELARVRESAAELNVNVIGVDLVEAELLQAEMSQSRSEASNRETSCTASSIPVKN